MTPERYQGGKRVMIGSGVVGLIGLGLTAVGAAIDLRSTLFSYLFAYLYWMSIAVCAVILLAIFHASHGKWMVVVRRTTESIASTSLILIPLFLPIAFGMKRLFIWVAPGPQLGPELLSKLQHQAPYLNVPFFIVRAVVYFAIWAGVAFFLRRWSVLQDDSGDLALTRKQRILGAASLPFLSFALTFAAFDWVMSLNPAWYSTIYGVYVFSGGILSALAVLSVVAALAPDHTHLGASVTPEHLHNLGKFLLAFVIFWAYIAYSQYMLIWIGNLPEEIVYYLPRSHGAWGIFSWVLIFVQFVIPFFALLSRELKRRRRGLAFISIWLLVAHVVDSYWLVMPTLEPSQVLPRWTDFTAFVGVGGIAVAFGLLRQRGVFAIPIGDPYLAESLRYSQP